MRRSDGRTGQPKLSTRFPDEPRAAGVVLVSRPLSRANPTGPTRFLAIESAVVGGLYRPIVDSTNTAITQNSASLRRPGVLTCLQATSPASAGRPPAPGPARRLGDYPGSSASGCRATSKAQLPRPQRLDRPRGRAVARRESMRRLSATSASVPTLSSRTGGRSVERSLSRATRASSGPAERPSKRTGRPAASHAATRRSGDGGDWAGGDHERRAPTELAPDTLMYPPPLLHDPVHDRQTEAGALALLLRGEERLEELSRASARPCRCRYR